MCRNSGAIGGLWRLRRSRGTILIQVGVLLPLGTIDVTGGAGGPGGNGQPGGQGVTAVGAATVKVGTVVPMVAPAEMELRAATVEQVARVERAAI